MVAVVNDRLWSIGAYGTGLSRDALAVFVQAAKRTLDSLTPAAL